MQLVRCSLTVCSPLLRFEWSKLIPSPPIDIDSCECWCKVRTVERSVEGLHSLVKRSLSRAPASKISCLSMELRYSQLFHSAVTRPSFMGEMARKLAAIVTLKGFRHAVLHLELDQDVFVSGIMAGF